MKNIPSSIFYFNEVSFSVHNITDYLDIVMVDNSNRSIDELKKQNYSKLLIIDN